MLGVPASACLLPLGLHLSEPNLQEVKSLGSIELRNLGMSSCFSIEQNNILWRQWSAPFPKLHIKPTAWEQHRNWIHNFQWFREQQILFLNKFFLSKTHGKPVSLGPNLLSKHVKWHKWSISGVCGTGFHTTPFSFSNTPWLAPSMNLGRRYKAQKWRSGCTCPRCVIRCLQLRGTYPKETRFRWKGWRMSEMAWALRLMQWKKWDMRGS